MLTIPAKCNKVTQAMARMKLKDTPVLCINVAWSLENNNSPDPTPFNINVKVCIIGYKAFKNSCLR